MHSANNRSILAFTNVVEWNSGLNCISQVNVNSAHN